IAVTSWRSRLLRPCADVKGLTWELNRIQVPSFARTNMRGKCQRMMDLPRSRTGTTGSQVSPQVDLTI
ncbi:MAG: hypothetical protein VX034_15620, partial [Planctomycetota bacterium]|nr:hypothetical protein [Planctomycetota bacterium]